MKRLVAFELEDKSTIVVETNEPESGMTTRGFQHPQELVENASQTFAQALSKIRPATEQVMSTLHNLIHKPDEIEMEFGFSFNAAAGVVLASVSSDANYKVTLRWTRESRDPQN